MSVAMVTGASRGIGRAIAVGLAAEGFDVVAVARDGAMLDEVGALIEDRGRRYMPLALDLGTVDGPATAAERAWTWSTDLTVLVNVAGLVVGDRAGSVPPHSLPEPVPSNDDSAWDRTIALNLRAPQILMETLGRRMFDTGKGAIVNVASLAGAIVTRAPAPYQASKAALIQLTRYYAVHLAPKVRVNAVGPGYVRTDLNRTWLSVPENEEWVLSKTPLARVGLPEDVVGPVVFLATDRSSYVTGQHMLVDGGWSVV
jgi:NAD(P)-dependent dehydrogenase (short-subunit alcohol dehydrogenase family)